MDQPDIYHGQSGQYYLDPDTGLRVPADEWVAQQALKAKQTEAKAHKKEVNDVTV